MRMHCKEQLTAATSSTCTTTQPTCEREVMGDKGDGPALHKCKGGHHKLGHRQQEAAGRLGGAHEEGMAGLA